MCRVFQFIVFSPLGLVYLFLCGYVYSVDFMFKYNNCFERKLNIIIVFQVLQFTAFIAFFYYFQVTCLRVS